MRQVDYVGCIDLSMQSHIQGWASNGTEPTSVSILVNGNQVGSADPTIMRPDVNQAGYALLSGWTFNHLHPLDIDDKVTVLLPNGVALPFAAGADHAVRLRELTYGLDRDRMTGLELGPLNRPLLGKNRWHVRYIDHASREELIEKYGSDSAGQLDTSGIVETDIVWLDGSLVDRLPTGEQYDFAIASHVIEHVPDMLGWLGSISAALRPGGLINLAIPARDETFDRFRAVTTPAEIVDDYVRKLTRPSARQLFDHICNASPIGGERQYNPLAAVQAIASAEVSGAYIDAHCRVFTPHSFLSVCRVLADAGLLKLSLVAFYPTRPGSNEFVVSLRVSPDTPAAAIAASYAIE